MYLEYFGFERNPFEQTPDSEFLYLSDQHSYALASMKFAIAKRDPVAVITGEIGSGKTTLLNRVLSELSEGIEIARVTNTQLTETEVLQAILVEFGFKPFRKKKIELLYDLRKFIEAQADANQQVVLMIDEAQNLTRKVLEELRMLTSIGADKSNLVTLLLLGQPELNRIIDDPLMEQLRQRCRLRLHIQGLMEEEIEAYVKHRVSLVGGNYNKLFKKDVLKPIYDYSNGIPRLINIACDTVLTACFLANKKKIDQKIIDEALTELGPSSRQALPAPSGPPLKNSASSLSLQVLHENGQIENVVVSESGGIAGRSSDCAIFIDSTYVSNHHALFNREGSLWVVTDLNSTNGTFVSDRPIRRHVIADGDILKLGTSKVICQIGSSGPIGGTGQHDEISNTSENDIVAEN